MLLELCGLVKIHQVCLLNLDLSVTVIVAAEEKSIALLPDRSVTEQPRPRTGRTLLPTRRAREAQEALACVDARVATARAHESTLRRNGTSGIRSGK